MYYIVQENIFNEKQYDDLIYALKRLNLDFEIVKINPFIEDVEFETDRKDIFVFGATKLIRLSKKYNWHPGALMTENHDFLVYKDYYKENLLNYDSEILDINSDIDLSTVKFIRPCKDTKDFDGKVFDKELWERAKEYHFANGWMKKDSKIQVSEVKRIYKEYRFFIVDGKISTSSQYKQNGILFVSNIVDDDAEKFCEDMINIFCLDKAFVMDIAMTDHGFKIVECGCINCAGLYAIDSQKLLIDLEYSFVN